MRETAELFSARENALSIMEAIYHRRAVRDYKPDPVDMPTIHTLLYAAVQAPTAMHEEPWAFAVIQDRELLDRLSLSAREGLWYEPGRNPSSQTRHLMELISRPDFNVFYNASTLIVIYGKPSGEFVAADCWLAAENIMLAATGMGLGSCVIGMAVKALNRPEWKRELGIPEDYTAYAPILLGIPASHTPAPPRKAPDVLAWRQPA